MTGSEARLALAIFDPSSRGGTLALTRVVYDIAAEAGLAPYLAYNRVPGLRGERERSFLQTSDRSRVADVEREVLFGMEGVAVRRRLPEFEFLNYTANISAWNEALAAANMFFGVCGNSLAALPLALAKKDFSIWVASTLYEDRIARLRREPFFRKIRNYISLPLLLRQERYVLTRARRIFAISRYTMDAMIARYPFVENKIEVLPYPVDADLFHPPSSAGKENVILFTGRLADTRKNIPLLLTAFAEARKERPGIALRLVGSVLNDRSQALLEELDLKDAVTVLPYVDRQQLAQEYANAALFVIPSFQEGLCISGLEAMASGVPVVATRCGGPEDFVVEGRNGMLVPVNDEARMTAAIRDFFGLPAATRQAMSQAARSFVLEHHSMEAIRPKLLNALGV